jgi:hypothetical protein
MIRSVMNRLGARERRLQSETPRPDSNNIENDLVGSEVKPYSQAGEDAASGS